MVQAFFFNGFSLFGFGLKVSVNVGPLCWAFAKFRPTRKLGFVFCLVGLDPDGSCTFNKIPEEKKRNKIFN